jgi:hypothetical protein
VIPTQLGASYAAHGKYSSLIHLAGPGLERLSASARRRLLALALAGPTSREPRGRLATRYPAPPEPLLYLLRQLPSARRIELRVSNTEAVGIASAQGDLAVASFRTRPLGRDDAPPPHGRVTRGRWWTESYGDRPPLGELERIIDEWHEVNVNGKARFRIEVRRTSETNGRVRLGWTDNGS